MNSRLLKWVLVWVGLSAGSAQGAGDADLAAEADGAARGLMQRLGTALQAEMAAGGPAAAIGVCAELAPRIAGEISRDTGWRVTRVGTRVRNPLLGMPDAWEQAGLQQFQARAADGEALAEMTHHEIVVEPDGRYFRFMRAIGTLPQCLACHGSREGLADPVREVLQGHYPRDQAVDYQLGDLRGAVSIKIPLPQ